MFRDSPDPRLIPASNQRGARLAAPTIAFSSAAWAVAQLARAFPWTTPKAFVWRFDELIRRQDREEPTEGARPGARPEGWYAHHAGWYDQSGRLAAGRAAARRVNPQWRSLAPPISERPRRPLGPEHDRALHGDCRRMLAFRPSDVALWDARHHRPGSRHGGAPCRLKSCASWEREREVPHTCRGKMLWTRADSLEHRDLGLVGRCVVCGHERYSADLVAARRPKRAAA